jgi:hypothetical protein
MNNLTAIASTTINRITQAHSLKVFFDFEDDFNTM